MLDRSADAEIDPEVERAWLVGRVCDEFNCLPRAAEFELDNDPDRLVLQIMDLRGYARAKTAFDAAEKLVADLKAWTGNPYMTAVQTITLEEHERRMARPRQDDGR